MVRELRASLHRDGMATACILGSLIARSIDVIELEDAHMPLFKISLLKRILSGINELLGQVHDYASRQSTLKAKMETFAEDLHSIRERLIKLVEQTRAAIDK
jgi:hypothetical protein